VSISRVSRGLRVIVMDASPYYQRVREPLRNCFQFSDYVVATGRELVAEGAPAAFPAVAEPLQRLAHLTVERGLQVHIPVLGARSRSVLMPLDIEIYLGEDNRCLYESADAQRHFFLKVLPVVRFLETLLRQRGMPYLLDYTPSGAHILFQNVLGYRATAALQAIGYLEEDLMAACRYVDPGDIRRRHGVSFDAARVFSGLGRLAEYMALLAMAALPPGDSADPLPITIGDAAKRCLNFDNSWSEGSPFMRCIRSPFSLHKKNREIYGQSHQPPLVDMIGAYFDGSAVDAEEDIDVVLGGMWDLAKAAEHAERFSGFIPCANETLIDFVEEYKRSDLFAWHQDFDRQETLPRGAAVARARRETRIGSATQDALWAPNPAALQPWRIMAMVADFLFQAQWQPKHIACVFRDLYQDPAFGWEQDFFKYPAEAKANFWIRTYSAVLLWKKGQLNISTSTSPGGAAGSEKKEKTS
jgi:hypothetical protein